MRERAGPVKELARRQHPHLQEGANMQQLSKPDPKTGVAPAKLLAREVAELHREKMELLEENASLKKGLEFLLGRYFSPGDCSSCSFSCSIDEQ